MLNIILHINLLAASYLVLLGNSKKQKYMLNAVLRLVVKISQALKGSFHFLDPVVSKHRQVPGP